MPQYPIYLLLIITLFLSSCTVHDSLHLVIGDTEMEEAKYRASKGDWIGAAEVWTHVVAQGNKRNAAKAAYNMAYACLVLDRPHIAMEWARTAAYDYNFPLVNDRAIMLLERLIDQYGDELACKVLYSSM